MFVPEMRVRVEDVFRLGVAVELDEHAVRIYKIAEVLAVGAPLRGNTVQCLDLFDRTQLIAERAEAGVRHSLGIVRPGVDR